MSLARPPINQKQVLKAFSYENGVLLWRIKPNRRIKIGSVAGCISKDRWVIGFEGALRPRSHLVWLMHKGRLPQNDLDHINRDAFDDRIENLRDISHSENLLNCCLHKNNTSGFRGVWFHSSRSKWVGEIRSRSKGQRIVRQFNTKKEAVKFVSEQGSELHGSIWSGVSP
jgi:hypothetical protein